MTNEPSFSKFSEINNRQSCLFIVHITYTLNLKIHNLSFHISIIFDWEFHHIIRKNSHKTKSKSLPNNFAYLSIPKYIENPRKITFEKRKTWTERTFSTLHPERLHYAHARRCARPHLSRDSCAKETQNGYLLGAKKGRKYSLLRHADRRFVLNTFDAALLEYFDVIYCRWFVCMNIQRVLIENYWRRVVIANRFYVIQLTVIFVVNVLQLCWSVIYFIYL